ncbi:MAG TPA: DUF2934 domain-containing protein [Terriglobia bacterium]|jgi:hypothetical protein|nr:DUF2934 domain-containing protein [Terriglobia bacterium]
MSDDLMTHQTQNSPQEEIAVRAHRLWEERGSPIGSPEADWSRAEDDVRREEAAEEERVRARNEGVRARDEARSRHEHEDGGVPPFTDFSGSL